MVKGAMLAGSTKGFVLGGDGRLGGGVMLDGIGVAGGGSGGNGGRSVPAAMSEFRGSIGTVPAVINEDMCEIFGCGCL